MTHIPDALQYAAPLGWAIIAGGLIYAGLRPRLSQGGAVAAAALAGFLAKTMLLDLT
jgi:hypothetical protein